MTLSRAPHPYHEWEDYRAGMYGTSPTPDLHTNLARDLLADPPTLGAAMRSATTRWPVAAEHRLTAVDENRRAWLGAAACWMVGNCPEHATRAGWWQLTNRQQVAANGQADDVIAEWEAHRTGVTPLFTLPWTALIGDRCA